MIAKSTYLKMSLEELIAERDTLNQIIAEKQTAAKEEFKNEIMKKAELLGINPLDLFGIPITARKNGAGKRVDVAVKYRDPANPANVWSGRGRMARWLQAYRDSGHNIDDFLAK